MQIAKRFLVGLVCLGIACRSDGGASPFQSGERAHLALSSAPSTVPLTSEEAKLITELTSLFPPEQRPLIARAFSDPFMVGAKAPQNPKKQALIDRIDAIRHARIDSITNAERAKPKTAAVPATVVLVPSLPDPTASAVVWRRAKVMPHDVIALRADNATLGTLGAGLHAFANLRREHGDSATVDEHVVVHGEYVLKGWQGDTRLLATGELYELLHSVPTDVAPFGAVRSRVFWSTPVGTGASSNRR